MHKKRRITAPIYSPERDFVEATRDRPDAKRERLPDKFDPLLRCGVAPAPTVREYGILNDSSGRRVPRVTMNLSLNRAVVAAVALIGLSGVARGQATTPARRDYTDADVRFVQGMIMHHTQAVVMSDWAATHGARPDLVILCKRIALSQRDEIVVMQQWLKQRGLSAPDPLHMASSDTGPIRDTSPMHMPGMDMGTGPMMMMAGMLSADDMRLLDAARDTTFDRLYLTGMIKHHQGAIAMVAELFATPAGGQQADLFSLATDVDAGQRVEIARMQAMLNTLTTTHPT